MRGVAVSLLLIGVALLVTSLVWESFFPLRSRWPAEAATHSAELTKRLANLLRKTTEARLRDPTLTGEPLALQIVRRQIAESDAARDRAIAAPVKTALRIRNAGVGAVVLGVIAWLTTLRAASASRGA